MRNKHRNRAWKYFLQQFADEFGLEVTVCHHPAGTSKWNKIEHRTFLVHQSALER